MAPGFLFEPRSELCLRRSALYTAEEICVADLEDKNERDRDLRHLL